METTLASTERRILDFEKRFWPLPGAKESAIRAEFGVSITRYYQQLNRLIDNPNALAAEPMLVRRLQRFRE